MFNRSKLKPSEIAAEFENLAPWVFRFRIDNVDYGGGVSAIGDPRMEWFRRFAPEARRILEVGPCEGAHTVMLAEQATKVVAVEGRETNLQRAELVRRLLGVRNAEFVHGNLETMDLAALGQFDAVFCSGLLCHLPEPWKLIEQLPRIAPKLFIWTVYADDASADVVQDGRRGRLHVEGGLDEPVSGLSPTAFWLTLGSLLQVLTASGYNSVQILHHDLAHPIGPAVTLGAATHEIAPPHALRWPSRAR